MSDDLRVSVFRSQAGPYVAEWFDAVDGQTHSDHHWPVMGPVEGLGGHVIYCACGEHPKKLAQRYSMGHVWQQTHRRRLGLRPVNYVWDGPRNEGLPSTGGLVRVRGMRWDYDGHRWVTA
jgi:hypothetical protein